MKAAGDWGEAQVARYLREKGYRLLASQYRCRFGEIDLIAEKGGIVAFVEVKMRTNLKCGLPREFVTEAKQRRLRTAAEFWLSEKEVDRPTRFDVAEVYTDAQHSAANTSIRYIEDAF